MLLDAFYAEAETDLHKHLDKVVGASSPCQGGHPSCWTGKQPIASKCAAGHFCALGTAPSGTSIGLLMEGRLVAGPVTQAGECWLASVATADLPAGEVVRAVALDGATRVLAEGSAPRTSEFTTAVTFVDRSAGSPMGDLGAGFAIASTMHTARLRDVTKDPETNPLDPLTFGVRYEGALFSQDWLHRVTVTAGWELFGKHPVRVTPGIALGGYFSAQTSGGGGALSAGFLSGVSVHVDFQVQWQVACSVGYELQALVANGNTSPLQTFYIGPRVGF